MPASAARSSAPVRHGWRSTETRSRGRPGPRPTRRSRRHAAGVPDARRRHVTHAPARRPEAAAQVGILPVEEVALVEPADRLERPAGGPACRRPTPSRPARRRDPPRPARRHGRCAAPPRTRAGAAAAPRTARTAPSACPDRRARCPARHRRPRTPPVQRARTRRPPAARPRASPPTPARSGSPDSQSARREPRWPPPPGSPPPRSPGCRCCAAGGSAAPDPRRTLAAVRGGVVDDRHVPVAARQVREERVERPRRCGPLFQLTTTADSAGAYEGCRVM